MHGNLLQRLKDLYYRVREQNDALTSLVLAEC
jgi:hypothetical protein